MYTRGSSMNMFELRARMRNSDTMIDECDFFFFSSRRRHTRYISVTGVQTCALPISVHRNDYDRAMAILEKIASALNAREVSGDKAIVKIGRASCRERV